MSKSDKLFILDTDCGPNCILCVDMKCVQCEVGYREDNGECFGK